MKVRSTHAGHSANGFHMAAHAPSSTAAGAERARGAAQPFNITNLTCNCTDNVLRKNITRLRAHPAYQVFAPFSIESAPSLPPFPLYPPSSIWDI